MLGRTCFLYAASRRKVRSAAASRVSNSASTTPAAAPAPATAAATATAVGTTSSSLSSSFSPAAPSSSPQTQAARAKPGKVASTAKAVSKPSAAATTTTTTTGARSVAVTVKRGGVARLLRQATADAEAAASGASGGRGGSSASPASVARPAQAVLDERAKDDAFTRLLDNFHGMTAPLSDSDEVVGAQKAEEEGVVHKRASSVVTCRDFSASLVCPKKFYLSSARPDLMPGSSMGEVVHLDDGVGFNELARRWDRLQFGSKAVLVSESDHDAAAHKTEQVLIDYFTHQYAALGEQAPTLTLHRPAFSAPLQHPGAPRGAPALTLRARPCVVRYRPKENQWVVLEAQAILDPLNTTSRAALILQRLHFTMLTLRRGLSQPHIPIAVRKRFLDVDPKMLTEASLNEGKALFDGARPVAPIDVKRSGLLHIRQFLPGPVTLMDCEPTRLVKFVQRLSLEDLLEADHKSHTKASGNGDKGRGGGAATRYTSSACTGAFDLQHMDDLDPAITPFYNSMAAAMKLCGRHANARSSRSLRARESEDHQLFEAQQQLMEALLLHHTLKIVDKSSDARQITRWTSFAKDSPDGLVRSTWDRRDGEEAAPTSSLAEGDDNDDAMAAAAAAAAPAAGKRGKRGGRHGSHAAASSPLPLVPCFSENVGGHCSRGDGCPFFAEGFCLPQAYPDPLKAEDNHLFTMPSTAVAKKSAWWMDGTRTVRDVLHQHNAGAIKLTAPQLRYAKAVSHGDMAICPKEVDKFFGKLRYPLFIIDFEAVQFALPPFEKVIAFQSVPFQFSLDVFQHDVFTETPTHYDYLHFGPGYSPNVDPRPACVRELLRIVRLEREKKRQEMLASGQLDDLKAKEAAEAEAAAQAPKPKRGRRKSADDGETGTSSRSGRAAAVEEPQNAWDGAFLAHFASFEKSCLEKLGQLEEEFKDEIKAFYFLDTLELFKKSFVHPNANGSNSLKKLLPAICPDFQYGVFGVEGGVDGDVDGADDSGQSDEQKGENAMAVYRMWYHQEGGGTIQDLQRGSARPGAAQKTDSTTSATVLPVVKEARAEVWARLRIQLLEYCSMDTKALYEIMREVKKEREAVADMKPEDKSGWVLAKPVPREINF